MFWQRFSKARHKKVETTKEGPRTKWMETWLSLAFRISRLGHPVCRLLKIRWRRSVEDNPSLTLLNLFISISSKPFHRHWQFLSSPNHWPESSLTDEKVKRIDDLDSLYSLHLNMPHNVYGFVQIPHSRIFDKLRVDKGSILNLPSLLVLVSLDLNIGDSYMYLGLSFSQSDPQNNWVRQTSFKIYVEYCGVEVKRICHPSVLRNIFYFNWVLPVSSLSSIKIPTWNKFCNNKTKIISLNQLL